VTLSYRELDGAAIEALRGPEAVVNDVLAGLSLNQYVVKKLASA
jgi:hypothetical protein